MPPNPQEFLWKQSRTPPNPPPEPISGPKGLRLLAAWFDHRTDLFPGPGDEVQRDLRRWADDIETARARIASLTAENERLREALERMKGWPWSFVLRRDEDVTGVSGTGVVAEGVEFSDGTVALRWCSEWPTSVVFHERGLEAVKAVHGHDGRTRIVMVPPTAWESALSPTNKEPHDPT